MKSTWTFERKKDDRIHSFPRVLRGKDLSLLSSLDKVKVEQVKILPNFQILFDYFIGQFSRISIDE